MSQTSSTDDVIGKLHRASCIVGFVARSIGERDQGDDVMVFETLSAVEELILDAMAQIEGRG